MVNGVVAISPGPSFYYYGCYNCTDSTVQYLIHSIYGLSGIAFPFDVNFLSSYNSKFKIFPNEFSNFNLQE
jgi:hypothetical protein